MKNRKGFTVIELLGAIVVLVVVFCIATPLVLNLISKSRNGSIVDDAYSLRKAANMLYSSMLSEHPLSLKDITIDFDVDGKMIVFYDNVEDSDIKFKIDGQIPSSGKIIIKNDGIMSYNNITIGKYHCYIPMYGEIKCTEISGNKNFVYADGEVVYYNPIENKVCNDYDLKNSETENKKGCMKWYAFLDDESSDKVNLILDHNTTARIRWNEKNINYFITDDNNNLKEELDNFTKKYDWKIKPRIIRADEVASITGNIAMWKLKPEFYFEENREYSSNYRSSFAWLYDNTYHCAASSGIDYGCTIEDNDDNYSLFNNSDEELSHQYGYWTATPELTDESKSSVWCVLTYGSLSRCTAINSNIGLRPVINVEKSVLN